MAFTQINGRRGNIVFFERYKKNIIREYIVPHDPKTAKQLSKRASYRFINKLWNFLPQPLFNKIWITLQSNLNQHNIFVKVNQNSFSTEKNFGLVKLSIGLLEPVLLIKSVKYKDAANRCIFNWDPKIIGNGTPNDIMLLILIDCKNYLPSKNRYILDIYINQTKTRKNAIGFITPSDNLDVTCLESYIIALTYPILNTLNVSDSKYKKVEAM